MVSQETTSGAPTGHGIAPRSQLPAFFRFPEGKLLISAEPVEVEIQRTEELISRQQALNNLKLHHLGVIGTLGVPVHVAIIGKLIVNF